MTAFTRLLPMPFETTVEPVVSPDGDGSAPVSAGEPGAAVTPPQEPATATPVAAPVTESFDFGAYLDTEEGQNALAEHMERLATQFAPQPTQVTEDYADVVEALEAFGVDPNRFDAFIQSKLGPLAQSNEQLWNQQAEQIVNSQIAALPEAFPSLFGSEVNEETAAQNRDLLLSIALGEQAQSQASNQPYDVARSFTGIAQKMAERDKVVSASAVEAFKRELEAAAGQPQSPAGAGAPALEGRPSFNNEYEFAADWAHRQGITR